MTKVFINPGHCPGIDSGAVNPNTGLQEADVALAVGRLVASYLTDAGCEVQLLQSDNLMWDGQGACVCQAANDWPADIFVSIHCNAANTEAQYSGTLVKTKIDKFLNVSGSRHCSIEQQCREVALCWRDVPDG